MILEQAFSFAPVGLICLHTTFGILKGGIILALLPQGTTTVTLLVDPDRTLILQYIPIVISFYMHITLHVPCPLPYIMHGSL